jgi:hypothetical protein
MVEDNMMILLTALCVVIFLWATTTAPVLYWCLGFWIAGSLWYWYAVTR